MLYNALRSLAKNSQSSECHSVLAALGAAHKMRDAERLFLAMQQWNAVRWEDEKVMLVMYEQARDGAKARRFLDSLKNPNTYYCNITMRAQSSYNDTKIIFDKMAQRAIKPDLISFNTLLRSRARTGGETQVEDAWSIYENLLHAGLEPEERTFLALIDACSFSSTENVEKGIDEMHLHLPYSPHTQLRIWDALTPSFLRDPTLLGVFLRPVTHSWTDNGMGKSRRKQSLDRILKAIPKFSTTELALSILEQCKNCTRRSPNERTYNNFISEFVKTGDCQAGYSVFVHMLVARGWKPQTSPALRELQSILLMEQDNLPPSTTAVAGISWTPNEKGPVPTHYTLNNLLRLAASQARSDFCDKAKRLIAWVKQHLDVSLDEYGLNISLGCMVKVGTPLDQILEFFDTNEKIATGLSWNLIMDACWKQNNFIKAFQYHDRFEKTGHKADVRTYTILMRCAKDSDDFEAVFQLYDDMKEKGIAANANTLRVLLESCDCLKDAGRAWNVYNELVRKLKVDLKDRFMLYRVFLKACVHAPTVDLAFQAFKDFRASVPLGSADRDELSGLYESLLDVCEAHNSFEHATDLVDEMKRLGVYRTFGTSCTFFLDGERVSIKTLDYTAQSARLTKQFVDFIKLRSDYKEAINALPLKAMHDLSARRSQSSLHLHAEKQALALLWQKGRFQKADTRPVPVLFVDVAMCADCQSFFKETARVLGKQLLVNNRGRVFRFSESDQS